MFVFNAILPQMFILVKLVELAEHMPSTEIKGNVLQNAILCSFMGSACLNEGDLLVNFTFDVQI